MNNLLHVGKLTASISMNKSTEPDAWQRAEQYRSSLKLIDMTDLIHDSFKASIILLTTTL